MNIALRRFITLDDYLAGAGAEADGLRTELINGQIVAMSPEAAGHNRVKLKIGMALVQAINASGLSSCEVFTDGMTVPIDAYTAYEPDALVHCGSKIPPAQLTAPAPIIVVEVISPTSRHSDTSAKLIGYFKIVTVRHYLVIDPDERCITHHARAADGTISAETLRSGALRLDPPGIAIEVAALFE